MRSLTIVALTAALLGSVTVASAAEKVADKTFIKKAIQGNLAEVQMGKLAQQNGQSEDVKSYGKMLVTDHSDANKKAMEVADKIGVTPPNEPSAKQKAEYDKMSKKTGASFDKAFAKEMVADHKKDIKEYKKESKMKNDPAGSYAANTLPTLQKHLQAAQKMEKSGSASR